MLRFTTTLLAGAFALAGCNTTIHVDDGPAEDTLAHGEYLVELLGCGRCHTEGMLSGDMATGPALAGSRIGIAWTPPAPPEDTPGIVFAPNLTPDSATGLGGWSTQQVARAIRFGVGSGHERLAIMPWPAYGETLYEEDIEAIARYLRALEPVRREIPENQPAGAPASHPYVQFSVFEFTPRP